MSCNFSNKTREWKVCYRHQSRTSLRKRAVRGLQVIWPQPKSISWPKVLYLNKPEVVSSLADTKAGADGQAELVLRAMGPWQLETDREEAAQTPKLGQTTKKLDSRKPQTNRAEAALLFSPLADL